MSAVPLAERASAPQAAAPPAPESGSRPLDRLRAVVPVVLVAGAVFGVAFNGGTYAENARDALSVALWWGIGLLVALSVWPRARLGRGAWTTGGFLLAFAAWTAASMLWAPALETAFTEFNRVTLYLGVFAVAVLAARRGRAEPWSDGMALGIAAVAVLAVLSRLYPDLVGAREVNELIPATERRLSYPVDYWNGLGILVALGFPLLLRAATAHRSAVARGLAVAPLPALAAAVYLTSSRGAAAVAVLGIVAFVLLTGRRIQAVAALMIAGAGSVGAVAVLGARSTLVNGPIQSHLAASQGRTAAPLILALCVAVAVSYALLLRFLPQDIRVGRGVRAAAWVTVAALLVGGVVAADPGQRLDRFKQPPRATEIPGKTYVESHLLSGGGAGRWQIWSAAADEFRTAPLIGRGAGTFEAWWAQHGTIPYFFRNAHSLWLETLGELGLIGLALLVATFGSALVVGARRLLGVGREARTTTAALMATVLAFALGAALEWVWQLAAVGGIAVLCLGLLAGPATLTAVVDGERPRRSGVALAARVAAVVACLALVVVHGLPLLAGNRLAQSQSAAGSGDTRQAISDALGARELEPWSSAPPLQLALLDERSGHLRSAERWIARGIDRNPDDWRLWLVATRLEVKLGDPAAARASLGRLKVLNPRSPVFKTGA